MADTVLTGEHKDVREAALDAFRRSAGFQIMFVLHSGLEIGRAVDHLCASAEKFSAALREWQPIETAPRYCEVLLWAGLSQSSQAIQGRWFSEGEQLDRSAGWYWASYSGAPVGPIPATHWMPLPDPPKATE